MSGPSPLPRGTRVGPFTLTRHLARGGTADIYVATRDGSPTPIALKLLTGLSSADRARAEREAAIAASLDHPHIARVTEHGTPSPDALYLAMELLQGQTLAQRLDDGPLDPTEAINVARQVLDALDHAHTRGIIHRDLKPANIFLVDGASNDIRVLDFGLARAVEGARVTTPGRVLGTPAYMSPEQVRGDRNLDARSDLWSVGAVLFEALSGHTPFGLASPLATLFQVAFSTPRRLDELAPQLPPQLIALVHRALSRDPSARPRDARAFREALGALDTHAAPTSSPPSAATPEVRLLSVVLASALRDPRLIERLLESLDATTVTTPGGVLAVLGLHGWRGDEPQRAVAFARAASLAAGAVAVLTTHAVTTADAVPQSLVDDAFRALPPDGLALDGTTASLVREHPRATEASTPRAPFVGRGLERSLLRDAVDRAVEDTSATAVIVLGARGMGRSRLLDVAAADLRAARPDAVILRARCEMDRRDSPFAAIREALRDDLHPGIDALLLTPARSSDPQAAFDRARADLDALFARLAERGPVVLAIDDAQWLDGASREVLRSIAGAAAGPLTLWFAAEPEARGALQSVAPGATIHALGPLPRADAESLARALGGADLDAVVDRAGGSPMMLEALATIPAGAALPVDVESAVRASLDRLDPTDRDFVLRASVFGRIAWVPGVLDLGASDRSASLRAKGWIAPRPRSRITDAAEFELRRALVVEVARAVFPEDLRRELHRRAAQWLAAQPAIAPEEHAAQWDLANDRDRAARAWCDAAERANRMGAMEAASAHCERVLTRSDDDALRWRALAARDDALQLNGDRSLQRKGLDAMLALAQDRDRRDEAQWRMLHHARMVGDAALAARHAEVVDGSRWSAAAHTELALFEADRGHLVDARRHAHRAAALAEGFDDPWLSARAAHALAYVLVEAGTELDEGLARYAEAGDGYRRAGDLRREAITLVNRGATFATLGRLADALDCLDLAIERARAVGNHRSVAVALENRGSVRRMLGDHEAADDDLTEAMKRAETLRFKRLSEAAAIERLYLALVTGHAIVARRDAVLPTLDEPEGSPHSDAALATCLRAAHALGEETHTLIARLDARLTEQLSPMSRVELHAARYAVTLSPEDRAAYADALRPHLANAVEAEDRAVRRRGVERRFAVPEALRGSLDD